jgi:hypothetical protein
MSRCTVVASFVLALGVAGCFDYQPVPLNSPTGELPGGVRITRSDSSMVVLAVAQVIGDTIRGFRENSTVRVLIPVSDVLAVETARVMPVETVAVATAGALFMYWITKKIRNSGIRRRTLETSFP